MTSLSCLSNKWTFYLHLHDNKDWSVNSYIEMFQVQTVEDAVLLNDEISYDLIKKTMMFMMKQEIRPVWEDENNRKGGCFSFKISNNDVESVWRNVFYSMLGRTLTTDKKHHDNVNGITLSPKKRFCILKIWMHDCSIEDPNIFIDIQNLNRDSCIFRKHCPDN